MATTLPYYEQKDIENIKKLREMMTTLPPFCTEFFRGIEPRTSTRTRIAYAYDPVSYTHLDHDVVLVSGSFGGDQYTVVVPADSYKYLWIGDDHVLYNISGSSVTCRMFQGGTFDPSSYNYTNLTLQPILGNSASTVYNNRYLSYKTYYYQTSNNWGNQLTSSTTYGNFYVDENGVSNQRSLGINYRSYYLFAVLIFLQGVNLLCYWKNLRH